MINKQRSYICVRSSHGLRKLIWLNEDASGVYIGWYGQSGSSHFSYHADGKCHHRIDGEPDKILPDTRIPIRDIGSPFPILTTGIFLRQGKLLVPGMEYLGDDPKSNTAIFLDVELLTNETLNAFITLFSRNSEIDFLRAQYKLAEVIGCPLLTLVSFSLKNFPNHKLGIALSGMKNITPRIQ